MYDDEVKKIVTIEKKKTLLKSAFTVNVQKLFSFWEMYKRNSDHFFHLFSDDRRESMPKVIHYFTETPSRFTKYDFSVSLSIEQISI